MTQVFSWIECGRWMPLRLSLVREVAAGLESEHVGALVASRIGRWFPGRVRWLHDVPAVAVKQPLPKRFLTCASRYIIVTAAMTTGTSLKL